MFYILLLYFRDNVEWDESQDNQARSQVCEHIKTKMTPEKAVDLENNADQYWDKFYSVHQEKYLLLILYTLNNWIIKTVLK